MLEFSVLDTLKPPSPPPSKKGENGKRTREKKHLNRLQKPIEKQDTGSKLRNLELAQGGKDYTN